MRRLQDSLLLLVAGLLVLPVLAIVGSWLQWDRVSAQVLAEMAQTVLPAYAATSIGLCLVVGAGVALVGGAGAAAVTLFDFPGRRTFEWALLLPLAMPAYVVAYAYTDYLQFSGPFQAWLRAATGLEGRVFPEVRSEGGAAFVFVFTLYPYVYLLARTALVERAGHLMEAARLLGAPLRRRIRSIAFPLARPAVAAGVALALMETLADFGTVAIFNYDTFTTAIYKAWFSLFSLSAASQLSSILILFVLILALAEQRTRSHMKYGGVGRAASHNRIRLSRRQALLATAYASLVFGIAFLIPLIQLLLWTKDVAATDLDSRYWEFVRNSLMLSGLGAAIVCALALLLGYAGRQKPGQLMQLTQRVATIGYAFPGTVLAVGVFIPVAWLDNVVIDLLKAQGWHGTEVLKGTLLVMLLAYAVRFLAVGSGPVDSGLQRVTRNIDEAARVMGTSTLSLLSRVHLPMLRASLFTAAALAFVDIMKEMPITLMTRPFGWDTLAVRVFEMTAEGEWERAALPSVAIILAGLVPIIFLAGRGENTHA